MQLQYSLRWGEFFNISFFKQGYLAGDIGALAGRLRITRLFSLFPINHPGSSRSQGGYE
jgi:hypothetical protein